MRKPTIFACVVLALAMATPMTAASGAGNAGFKTAQPSMLTAVKSGVEITPILTVGDVLPGGYRFESIPDGISLRTKGGKAEVYVNHETSKVPFPFNVASPTPANGESDFDNAQVSKLALNKTSAGVLNASFVIPSSAGFQRFCSNYLATSAEGFDREILFTNEESPDYVFRQEDSWPPPLTNVGAEENGLVVALDVKSGNFQPIFGMGRHNHENSVPVPGLDNLFVMSGDDTFTSGPLTIPQPGPILDLQRPAQSQLYSYLAADTDEVLADDGELYAFVSDTTGFNDYYDFIPGSAMTIEGHFIQVPKNIATGLNPDGTEMKAADVPAAQGGPFPAPPSDGTWQRDLRSVAPLGIDGPQWVLEYWSQLNNVFNFVRVEDIAYDKREGMSNTVYVVDSGRGTAGASQAGRSTNGRVWEMVLPDDPTVPGSVDLSIFVEGDDNPVQTPGEVHQPDNLETTATGILVTEDPGSSQQFPFGSVDPNATTARLWYVPFIGTPEVVVKVDQSADSGPTDQDGRAAGNLGAWEASGIVDASAAFGPGAFLIDVQAHTLWVDRAPGTNNFGDAQADFTFKREGGQLLLLRIPGI